MPIVISSLAVVMLLGPIVLLDLVLGPGVLSPLLAGLVVLGTALLGGQFVSLAWMREPRRFADVIRENRDALLVVTYGGLAVCWIIPAIFPVDVVQGGTLTNVFAHGVGFGVGIVVTVVVSWRNKDEKMNTP